MDTTHGVFRLTPARLATTYWVLSWAEKRREKPGRITAEIFDMFPRTAALCKRNESVLSTAIQSNLRPSNHYVWYGVRLEVSEAETWRRTLSSILAREITAWCPIGKLRLATSDSAAIATQLPRYLTSAWDTQEQEATN